MKDAIQKAIEEGWKPINGFHFEDYTIESVDIPDIVWSIGEVTNDPLFWQALINAIGQGKGIKHTYRRRTKKGSKKYITMKRNWRGGQRSWKYQWHRFIDHLASGKDADSFFKELLK